MRQNTPVSRPDLRGSRPYGVDLKRSRKSAGLILLGALLVAAALLGSGCGKRRPPLPPVERVPGRTEELTGYQQSNRILLSWPAPQRNAPDDSVQSIRRIDVYRLAESPDSPLPLTEEEFSNRSTLIGSVAYEEILKAGERLTYVDALELAGQPSRLRYALRYANASGQRAAFSNFFLIEPAAQIAEAPRLVGAQTTEKAVQLSWEPPNQNIDRTKPANLLGYNVYRSEVDTQGHVSLLRLNTTPVAGPAYADTKFKFTASYQYFVRAVSLGSGGNSVESLDSNGLSVIPLDTFAPAQPGTPSVAPGPGKLAIFFPSSPEGDIAGYDLFRSTDPNLPRERWTKLNEALLSKTTYQDGAVESGQKYYYYVVAVDQAGNRSDPSEVGSETVP